MVNEIHVGSSWRLCLAVMFLALLVRLFIASQLDCISRDGVQYVTYAKQLADEPVKTMQTTTKQPGFSYLLLGTHRVIGPLVGGDTPQGWQRCGQLLAIAGGVAACGLIYWLTCRLFEVTSAVVAGVLAAFWWEGAQSSAGVLSDMPHLALYLAALLIGLAALRSGRIRQFAVCGLLAGAAYALRQEPIGLVGAMGLCCLWPGQRIKLQRRILGLALMAVCFAAVVAPYAFAVGQVMPNKNLHDLFHGWPGTARTASGSWFMLAEIIPWQKAPARMAEDWAKNGRYAIAALVLCGLFLRGAPASEGTGRRLIGFAILVHLVLVQLRVVVYGETSARYMVIPAALSMPWAGSGLVALLNLIIGRLEKRGNALKGTVLVLGMLAPLAPQVYYHLRPANWERGPVAAAGRWLGENAKPTERVLAADRSEQVMFYADRTYPHDEDWVRFPEAATPDETARLIEQARPSWFVEVESPRRRIGNEATYFQELQRRIALRLGPAWQSTGGGTRVYVFELVQSPEEGIGTTQPAGR